MVVLKGHSPVSTTEVNKNREISAHRNRIPAIGEISSEAGPAGRLRELTWQNRRCPRRAGRESAAHIVEPERPFRAAGQAVGSDVQAESLCRAVPLGVIRAAPGLFAHQITDAKDDFLPLVCLCQRYTFFLVILVGVVEDTHADIEHAPAFYPQADFLNIPVLEVGKFLPEPDISPALAEIGVEPQTAPAFVCDGRIPFERALGARELPTADILPALRGRLKII